MGPCNRPATESGITGRHGPSLGVRTSHVARGNVLLNDPFRDSTESNVMDRRTLAGGFKSPLAHAPRTNMQVSD
jgi:hypothetical protein